MYFLARLKLSRVLFQFFLTVTAGLIVSQKLYAFDIFEMQEFSRCKRELKESILKLTSVDHQWLKSASWSRIPMMSSSMSSTMASSSQTVVMVYYVQLPEVGSQIAVKYEGGKIILSLSSGKIEKSVQLSSDECKMESEIESPVIQETKSEAREWTDENLKELLRNNQWGAIYTWSPQMHLSVLRIPVIEKVCQEMRIPLTILVDADASPVHLARVQRQKLVELRHLQKNSSHALALNGTQVHFPNLVFYKNGTLLRDNLLGAKSEPTYRKYIKETLLSGDSLK